MSAVVGSNVSKAWFFNIDGGEYFEVQYNPTTFQFDQAATWNEQEEAGKKSPLEFQKIPPAQVGMELLFDTTHDGSDVRTSWVNKLLFLTNPIHEAQDGQAQQVQKKRPPRIWFQWGSNRIVGVIESVNTTYLMFSPDGKPLRAKCVVKIKEWPDDEKAYENGSGGSMYDSTPVQLVTMRAGETVTAVALRMGTSTAALCEQNGIDDPFNVPAGTRLAAPRRS
jgi:hypothetical protein